MAILLSLDKEVHLKDEDARRCINAALKLDVRMNPDNPMNTNVPRASPSRIGVVQRPQALSPGTSRKSWIGEVKNTHGAIIFTQLHPNSTSEPPISQQAINCATIPNAIERSFAGPNLAVWRRYEMKTVKTHSSVHF